MKPTILHLICRSQHDWRLEKSGELLIRFDYKDDAIREVAWRAHEYNETQLVIHHADGSVEREILFGPGK